MQKNLDLYNPKFLAGVLEQIPDQPTFLRDMFFTNVETFITEEIAFDVYKGARKMTPFVHPHAPAPTSERKGYTTDVYTPAALKEQRVIQIADIQRRLAGEVVWNSGVTPEQRAAQLLAKDVDDLKGNFLRREEWMAAQILFKGEVQVNGVGVKDTISFGHDLKKSLSTKKWNTADADIFGDLLSWQTEVQKKSGYRPNTLIADPATIDMILRNDKVLKYFDNRNGYFGNNQGRDLGQGAAYCGRLAGQVNIDLYAYENYYEEEDSTPKPFVPEKTICLCNPAAKFTRAYGAITFLEDESNVWKTFEGEYRLYSYTQKHPDAQFIALESRPLLIPTQVDSFLVATIA